MKRSIIVSNIIIAVMLITIGSLAISNVNAISASVDNRVCYAGDTSQNNVAFMINVYQGEEYVLDILDILDVYNVKCTFFVGGCWAVNHLDIVRQIYSRGHELGNHGFYHKNQDKLDYEANIQEISLCHEVVLKNIGVEMSLFAPPSGAYTTTTVNSAESLNYKTIMWTHDTIDWRDQDDDLIFKRATKNLSNGDLILMHPTSETVKALTSILSYAINNGYNPTTVSKTINA